MSIRKYWGGIVAMIGLLVAFLGGGCAVLSFVGLIVNIGKKHFEDVFFVMLLGGVICYAGISAFRSGRDRFRDD
jgi:hypothetical protein